MAKILNFHLPADRPERAVAFYRDVFGWTFLQMPGATVPYFHGTADGIGIEGAITERTPIVKHPVPTIDVDDIDDVLSRLTILGGQPAGVTDIPGVGRFAYAKDCEGNTIALLERTKGGS